MNSQRLQITFPNKLAEDFRKAIPVGKRSQFIAQIISEQLPKWRKIIMESNDNH